MKYLYFLLMVIAGGLGSWICNKLWELRRSRRKEVTWEVLLVGLIAVGVGWWDIRPHFRVAGGLVSAVGMGLLIVWGMFIIDDIHKYFEKLAGDVATVRAVAEKLQHGRTEDEDLMVQLKIRDMASDLRAIKVFLEGGPREAGDKRTL